MIHHFPNSDERLKILLSFKEWYFFRIFFQDGHLSGQELWGTPPTGHQHHEYEKETNPIGGFFTCIVVECVT